MRPALSPAGAPRRRRACRSRVGSMLGFSKPTAVSSARNSCSSSAPATQPVQSAMFSRTAAGSPARTTTSDTANRPPGFSTRNASASTRALSPERLITQFEMITSTVFDGSGIASMWPLRNSTLFAPARCLVLEREREHLVGHVEAVRLAGRSDAPCREQHVDAAARAEVEDRLPFGELGERGRVAAAERREQRLGGKASGLAGVVEIGRDRVPRLARAAAAAARAFGRSATARGRPARRRRRAARLRRSAPAPSRGARPARRSVPCSASVESVVMRRLASIKKS